VTFACIGLVLAIVMGRLGHSPFAWGLLGLLLGPIALLLALVEVRNERPWWTRLVASGDPGSGPVDVLVGIDGSPESAAATTAALELLGDRVGRLTLVAVTEVDDSTAGREERARLRQELERQAEAVRAWLQERDGSAQAKLKVTPELQLMSGPPARTLDTIAAEDGYGLLVVGARGAGMSSVLLGSVATRLAARASVPVLIIGDQVVSEKAQLVMADRFRLEKVSSNRGPTRGVARPAGRAAQGGTRGGGGSAGHRPGPRPNRRGGGRPPTTVWPQRTGRAGARQVPLGQGEDTAALRPPAGRQREASTAPSGSGWRSGWPACSSCCG
jgi:nucleotide-binding universal stress UspA family protein